MSADITVEVRRGGKLIYDGVYMSKNQVDCKDSFHALIRCIGHLTGWGATPPPPKPEFVKRRESLVVLPGGRT